MYNICYGKLRKPVKFVVNNKLFVAEDCKKRWRNIKDTYNKKKRSRKLGTGSAAKDKPSKWMLADILSFMDSATYERQ